jgi:hypothetical protein
MDAAEAARPATFDWRVYDDDDVDAERRARLIRADLISSLESDRNRSRKHARVAASGDAVLGLQEARLGDAGVKMPAAECVVCLQDFVVEDCLRAMPCSHTFHQDCILRWLRVNHVCPLCRHALLTRRPRVAPAWAERAYMVHPEPAEDAVLMEGVGAGHHPELVLRHEILQAHGALRRRPDPRVAGPGLLQAQDGVAGGGEPSTLDAAVGFRRIRTAAVGFRRIKTAAVGFRTVEQVG